MTKEVKVADKKTKTTFRPNGARFLIKVLKENGEKKTTGGIIIPGGEGKSLSEVVEIISIGTGFDKDSLEMLGFKEGDLIEVVKRMREEITCDLDKYELVHNDHVLGKYSEV